MAAEMLDRRALRGTGAVMEHRVSSPTLAEVYAAHFRYVFRCLRSLGVRDGVLDDALQDVFLVVQNKLADFDGRAELRTWLYAIALRVARRYRVRSSREADALECDAERGGTADLELALQQSERLALARRALDALDDEKREVFVLAQIEQMSAPEIAEVTGLPVNTVYSRLRAARQAFAAEIARLDASQRRSR